MTDFTDIDRHAAELTDQLDRDAAQHKETLKGVAFVAAAAVIVYAAIYGIATIDAAHLPQLAVGLVGVLVAAFFATYFLNRGRP